MIKSSSNQLVLLIKWPEIFTVIPKIICDAEAKAPFSFCYWGTLISLTIGNFSWQVVQRVHVVVKNIGNSQLAMHIFYYCLNCTARLNSLTFVLAFKIFR